MMPSFTSCNLGLQLLLSPHVRESRFRISDSENFCLWNLEFGKILFVESGILGYGIRYTAQGMLNATDDWNPESKDQLTNYWNPVPGIQNPQRGVQTPRLSWIFLATKSESESES